MPKDLTKATKVLLSEQEKKQSDVTNVVMQMAPDFTSFQNNSN